MEDAQIRAGRIQPHVVHAALGQIAGEILKLKHREAGAKRQQTRFVLCISDTQAARRAICEDDRQAEVRKRAQALQQRRRDRFRLREDQNLKGLGSNRELAVFDARSI